MFPKKLMNNIYSSLYQLYNFPKIESVNNKLKNKIKSVSYFLVFLSTIEKRLPVLNKIVLKCILFTKYISKMAKFYYDL